MIVELNPFEINEAEFEFIMKNVRIKAHPQILSHILYCDFKKLLKKRIKRLENRV
ncbi:hypothetical protein [Sulfurisphaera tokodaii]|uniref:Uncharacterized protein n=1 Tax=Sulfurisphaera tokodaii TaxID=111955 RepID=A0A832WUC2_9CREN|nr:hypothetical protein [Sulfurisphaera tokodaii]HII75334.1 hypothetical protein [Sulfurisphaera tokodaii]